MKRSSIETLDISWSGQNDWMIIVFSGLCVAGILIAVFHPLFTRKN